MKIKHITVQITQKALIAVNGEVLMVLEDGEWELPGGHVDEGEKDLVEALRREMREELSVEVKVGNIFTADLFTKTTGEMTLAIVYKCEMLSSKESIKPQESEVEEWKFYSKSEGEKLEGINANSVAAVEKYFSQ